LPRTDISATARRRPDLPPENRSILLESHVIRRSDGSGGRMIGLPSPFHTSNAYNRPCFSMTINSIIMPSVSLAWAVTTASIPTFGGYPLPASNQRPLSGKSYRRNLSQDIPKPFKGLLQQAEDHCPFSLGHGSPVGLVVWSWSHPCQMFVAMAECDSN
jgi:hypothetical protein